MRFCRDGARLIWHVRTLKPQVSAGEALRFDPTEIGVLADSMRSYVRSLCDALDQRFGLLQDESA